MIAGQIEIQMMANMARLAEDMHKAKELVGGSMDKISEMAEGAKKALELLGIGLGMHEFYELIKGSIEAQDHLNDLSKTTSLTVETLAGLQFASKSSGSDLESMTATISKLSENMGKSSDKFAALGVTAKDPLEAFKQLSDIFSQIDDPQIKAALGAEALGKGWKTAAPLMAEGSVEIQNLVDKGTRLNGITTESAKQADAFNDKMLELVGTGGLMNKMVTPLLPLLNMLADDFIKARDEASGMDSSFKPLLETGKALTVLFGNVGFVLNGMGKEIGGIAAQATLLATGQFKAAMDLGDIMKKEAIEARTSFDAWEERVMAVGTAAEKTAGQVKQASAEELAAAAAAAAIAKAKAQAFITPEKQDSTDKEAQRKREALATLQEKTLDDWMKYNQKLQDTKDQAGLKDDQRIGYQWSKTLEDIERRKTMLQDYGMWSVGREQEYNDAKVNAASIASAAMIKLAENEAKAKQAVLQGALGTISSLMSSKNKELFEIGKAASIANATISTIEGATKALSYGPFIGPPLAALVIAAGLANVAMIASTQIGGGAASPTNATLGGGGSSTPTPVYGGNPGGPSTPSYQNNDQSMAVTTHLTINAPGADAGVVSRIREMMPALISENRNAVYSAVNQTMASRGKQL
jgi:hypothetical protein